MSDHYVAQWKVTACLAAYCALGVPVRIIEDGGRSAGFYGLMALFFAWLAWRERRALQRYERSETEETQ